MQSLAQSRETLRDNNNERGDKYDTITAWEHRLFWTKKFALKRLVGILVSFFIVENPTALPLTQTISGRMIFIIMRDYIIQVCDPCLVKYSYYN